MPQRDVRLYLHDIALAARLLAEFTDGKAWSDYQADALLRSGVERQFEVVPLDRYADDGKGVENRRRDDATSA